MGGKEGDSVGSGRDGNEAKTERARGAELGTVLSKSDPGFRAHCHPGSTKLLVPAALGSCERWFVTIAEPMRMRTNQCALFSSSSLWAHSLCECAVASVMRDNWAPYDVCPRTSSVQHDKVGRFAHADREVLGLDVGTEVANVWAVDEAIEEVRTKRMETLRIGRGIHDELHIGECSGKCTAATGVLQ